MEVSAECRRKIEEQIAEKRPLVQCITNMVTVNDCANALLAIGARATMAHHKAEAAEVAAGCDALEISLGATDDYEAAFLAAKQASLLGHPIVVDPVGCGGSSYRREFFGKLAKEVRLTCVRGNASEITALALQQATTCGVDSAPVEGEDEIAKLHRLADQLAENLSCIVIASGPIDYVTDGSSNVEVAAGDPMMSRITGTGCMSSAMLGAYLAVEPTILSAAACIFRMGEAGGIAAEETRKTSGGTMTFHTLLIDCLSRPDLL